MASARFHNAGDGHALTAPFVGFRLQLLPAASSKGVIFCSAVVFCGLPASLDASFALQSAEGREQRARVDGENSLADLFNSLGDAVAVHRLKRQCFQDQHVEGALDDHSFSPLGSLAVAQLDCQEELSLFIEGEPRRGGSTFIAPSNSQAPQPAWSGSATRRTVHLGDECEAGIISFEGKCYLRITGWGRARR